MSTDYLPGSFGGDPQRIADDTKLECKICWYVYDPAIGDEYWQVASGTPFRALPDHWSCPECDGRKQDFMVLDEAS